MPARPQTTFPRTSHPLTVGVDNGGVGPRPIHGGGAVRSRRYPNVATHRCTDATPVRAPSGRWATASQPSRPTRGEPAAPTGNPAVTGHITYHQPPLPAHLLRSPLAHPGLMILRTTCLCALRAAPRAVFGGAHVPSTRRYLRADALRASRFSVRWLRVWRSDPVSEKRSARRCMCALGPG